MAVYRLKIQNDSEEGGKWIKIMIEVTKKCNQLSDMISAKPLTDPYK